MKFVIKDQASGQFVTRNPVESTPNLTADVWDAYTWSLQEAAEDYMTIFASDQHPENAQWRIYEANITLEEA